MRPLPTPRIRIATGPTRRSRALLTPGGISGTPSDDVIVGLGGDDFIEGGRGRDVICAGDGNDTVVSSDGNDALAGQDGDDGLYAGAEDDFVDGGRGQDYCDGGGQAADRVYGCTFPTQFVVGQSAPDLVARTAFDTASGSGRPGLVVVLSAPSVGLPALALALLACLATGHLTWRGVPRAPRVAAAQ